MWPLINFRDVQDIWVQGGEEVSHDMTGIPSFAGDFPFTNVPQQMCIFISTAVTFRHVSACSEV
jgi:hypothetical protein